VKVKKIHRSLPNEATRVRAWWKIRKTDILISKANRQHHRSNGSQLVKKQKAQMNTSQDNKTSRENLQRNRAYPVCEIMSIAK
jgi:hypothetical protein